MTSPIFSLVTPTVLLLVSLLSASDRPVVVPGPVCAGQTNLVRIGPEGYFAPVCEEMTARADMLFEFNSARLKPSSREIILKWSILLLADTRAYFVDGHADAIGTDAYNYGLSMRRAQAVRDALVKTGVPAARLTPRGFGKTRPVAPNTNEDGSDNPDGRAMNRRVELTPQ